MRRIDDLIAEHCPGGVPYVRVEEAFNTLATPRGIKRSDYSLGTAIPIVDQGQSLVAGYTDDESRKIAEGQYVIFGDHTRAVKWIDFAFAVGADGTKVLSAARGILPKYAYYAMVNLDITDRGYNRHWTIVRDLRIPVPPLEVQREIVRILDRFTQLEAELEAELEARHTQYNHYRRAMLDLIDAPRVSLADLGSWRGGMTPSRRNSAYWVGGDIPWIASMDVSDESTNRIRGQVTARALEETALKLIPGPSIPVVMRSNILRRTLPIGFVEVDTTVNQDIRSLVAGDGVDIRYAYQVLRADSERIRKQCVRTDGSMAAVSSKSFFAWQVPLPDLAEQRRIATALDEFDALVNDFSIGLPAELAARRKQYEYYRDRLLTFKELES